MTNIFDCLKKNALKNPDKIALILDDKHFTYSQLFELTKNVIFNFKSFKINSKCKILLIEDNTLAHILTLLAAAFLNACVVPVSNIIQKTFERIVQFTQIDFVIGNNDYCKLIIKK